MTPVYGDAAATQSVLALTYAEPQSRLEQVFYRELSARLSAPHNPNAPELSARVSVSATRLGLSEVASPVVDRQIVANVTYSVTRDGAVIASGSRRASANYQTTGQIVGDDEARINAQEAAVRAAADMVRLALLAELAPQ
ncbi:hypothetical protein [Pelagibacterium luteolum]|uniref:LPS-assembly lipoprotein n=1 Tax=Pelagibacterium luteolum TaxID=440168 RepID=A0A1G7SGV1_9HYPH|nr:hypothetical protein [Pelagibacterium luteolum]SDG22307.1 hypothetical protein SAMN04487974_101508 [Pelagibacterium luteolum]